MCRALLSGVLVLAALTGLPNVCAALRLAGQAGVSDRSCLASGTDFGVAAAALEKHVVSLGRGGYYRLVFDIRRRASSDPYF